MSAILLNADPCPWCKGKLVWLWDKAVPGAWCVACSNPDCAATGPLSRISEADAVLQWNRAPRLALLPRSNAALDRALDELQGGDRSERR